MGFAARCLLAGVLVAGFVSCGDRGARPSPEQETGGDHGLARSTYATSSALAPLPQSVPGLTPARVALGRQLFNDKRLSGDGLITCHDCHSLSLGGSNGQSKSSMPNRPPVPVNVPSVLNAAYEFRYSWNGRFETLEDQIDFALTTEAGMVGTWSASLAALSSDAPLKAKFDAAYPEGMTEITLRDSLVEYVRSLATPNSRFDRYLRGEFTLTETEMRGYDTFRDYGCVSCHQGVNVGGNMYQRFGVMQDYFADRGGLTPADMGLYNATKRESDRHVFRVPSLRNVALTAPYFHDGSALSLEQAITTMGRYQLGRELSAQDTNDIAAFLRSLTGELDGRPL